MPSSATGAACFGSAEAGGGEVMRGPSSMDIE